MKKILSNIIIIVSLLAFIYFSYKIFNYFKEEKEQESLNNGIIDIAIKKNENTENNEIMQDENIQKKNILPIEVDFENLKEKNKDIIAWIYSENTPINYPVVKTSNNDYYLRRLIDGTYNQAGTLFVDYKNSSDFSDYNTIIYGHNMKNGAMFGTLTNYSNQEYYDEHKEIFFFTEDKNYKIVVFAGFTTSSESDIYKFPKTSNTNEKLINKAIKNSTFKSDIEVTSEDRIITLSTCSYSYENARYILLGVLKEIE